MEKLPIEKDPRYKILLSNYSLKVQSQSKMDLWKVSGLFSFFFAPFYTVAASMQMSVKAHENLYGTPQRDRDALKMFAEKTDKKKMLENSEGKSLVKSDSNANIKVFESKRTKKLKKLAGSVGKNAPYRAPVYQTYGECIRGLYKQGVLGFYKGNLYRHHYMLSTSLLQLNIAHRLEDRIGSFRFFCHLFAGITADTLFHPLHLIESRYILQNRIPAFTSYKSLYTLALATRFDVYQGVACHIPKNVILAFGYFSIFTAMSPTMFLIKELAIQALIYPIITVMRRIEAQTDRAGMIPQRYINARHCLGLTWREEGIRGLYRGFTSFSIGMTLFLALVPLTAYLGSLNNPVMGFRDPDEE
ncbi:unnamed protein product [Moneuplotes crassus]|uniref:Uncharacterized protein n=1 Tax=Euplotes crassus TaxID=5936 RepID=A0AAD1URS2_EUPCR|nr:unnamed protein product [Moneuplotes crassus]